MLSDPSQQQPHRRSVSSMFGNMFCKRDSGSVNIANSMTTPTQLTVKDDEDNESSYSRSQSARSYSKPYGYANTDIYSVTFQSKPFGLTLNAFDEVSQIGAVVMVNHNVNDQIVDKRSRFVSVNNIQCKDFQFERIKDICRNATLPTCIQFLRPSANQTNLSPKHKPSKQNKHKKDKSPRNSPRHSYSHKKEPSPSPKSIKIERNESPKSNSSEKEKTKSPKPKKKKATKPKESLKAKQHREKKAAKQLMESLGGMDEIKKAEKYEKKQQWALCVESYGKGVEDLEKSLKTLDKSGILTPFQQQQCQQQIDVYCRNLIKLQREHAKAIAAANQPKPKPQPKAPTIPQENAITNDTPSKPQPEPLIFAKPKAKKSKLLKNNVPVHQRAVTGIVPKKKKKSENKRHSLTPRRLSHSYNENVDEEDESAVFGTKKSSKPKRESAVALKKKEMARMQREMKTGKIENIPSDENKSNKKKEDDGDNKPDDIYSFLDRSEETKKHKAKMNKETTTKK